MNQKNCMNLKNSMNLKKKIGQNDSMNEYDRTTKNDYMAHNDCTTEYDHMHENDRMAQNDRMDENLKYNAWLNAVKTNQPMLSDPDGLMRNIMSDIQSAQVKKSSKKIEKIWKMVASASAVAAMFLLCLFVYEIDLHPNSELNTAVSTDQFDDSALKQRFAAFSDECSNNKESSGKLKKCILKRWQEQREVQAQKKMQILEKRYSYN